MQIMMTYNFGDILLVPFPFTNQSSIKKRPTVVISSNNYNSQKPDLIIMAITSQLNSSLNFGEMIISDFLSAGLLKPSVVKPVITTI
jgi:mRNA interferase MazF